MKRSLVLVRDKRTERCTLGKLCLDGVPVCDTLELPWRENKSQISCIPCGTYPVVFREDPGSKYAYRHLHVQDVPGRSWILVHIGNYPEDTLGCILPGMTRGRDYVGHSGDAFNKLMALLEGSEEMTLTIE